MSSPARQEESYVPHTQDRGGNPRLAGAGGARRGSDPSYALLATSPAIDFGHKWFCVAVARRLRQGRGIDDAGPVYRSQANRDADELVTAKQTEA